MFKQLTILKCFILLLTILLISANGYAQTAWQNQTSDKIRFGKVSLFKDKFIAIENNNINVSSDGGSNWQRAQTPSMNNIGIVFENIVVTSNKVLVFGSDLQSQMLSSDDGETWQIPQSPINNYQQITSDGDRFFATTSNGEIFSSVDLEQWSLVSNLKTAIDYDDNNSFVTRI